MNTDFFLAVIVYFYIFINNYFYNYIFYYVLFVTFILIFIEKFWFGKYLDVRKDG